MTLREAAQALVDSVEIHGLIQMIPGDKMAALRTALALPDAGWEEGAEAMRDQITTMAAGVNISFAGRGREILLEQIHALPLPRSPVTAPEAKTAESEVGWVIRMPHETLAEAVWGTLEEARGLRDDEPKGLIEGATAVRVRITVAPAPVEPEETRR